MSVRDLFLGAIIPGTMLAVIYGIYCLYRAYTREGVAPALPDEVRTIRGWSLVRELLVAVFPIILLILAWLGTIFAGIATPDRGGIGRGGCRDGAGCRQPEPEMAGNRRRFPVHGQYHRSWC